MRRILPLTFGISALALQGCGASQGSSELASFDSDKAVYSRIANYLVERPEGVNFVNWSIPENKFVAPRHVANQIRDLAARGYTTHGGHKFRMSEGLTKVFAALADTLDESVASGYPVSFGVLSLVRSGESLHGVIGTGEYGVTRAVDIDVAGYGKIWITDPAYALSGILHVLDSLPGGEYHVGLPRAPDVLNTYSPNQYATDKSRYGYMGLWDSRGQLVLPYEQLNVFIAPKHNVCSDHMCASWASGDQILGQNERETIEYAVTQNEASKGVRIPWMYSDGLDHMHVEVVSNPNP